MGFPKLVIFDMDGLMFDTETIARQAWDITGKKFHFDITNDTFNNWRGLVEKDITRNMSVLFGEEAPVTQWRQFMRQTKNRIIDSHKRVYKMKGLDSIIRFLKQKNVPMAVASSNEYKNIVKYLEYENLNGVFDCIVSGDDVSEGKPNPEIFLKVCNSMNCAPSQALVLEDSYNGVSAAINGGIPVFWVTSITRKWNLKPTKCFDDLEEVEQYLREYKEVK